MHAVGDAPNRAVGRVNRCVRGKPATPDRCGVLTDDGDILVFHPVIDFRVYLDEKGAPHIDLWNGGGSCCGRNDAVAAWRDQ